MTAESGTENTPTEGDVEVVALGDGGKKALEAERTARRAAEAALAERDAADLRAAVAVEHELTEAQAKFITGSTAEEFAASAADLKAAFATEEPAFPATPRERLKPGAVPGANDAPPDYGQLADTIVRATSPSKFGPTRDAEGHSHDPVRCRDPHDWRAAMAAVPSQHRY